MLTYVLQTEALTACIARDVGWFLKKKGVMSAIQHLATAKNTLNAALGASTL